jgi:Tfp pilus assembly protein PilX
MILIILTLLALSVAQVTSLQERMAGLYLADQVAFQEAEDNLRVLEMGLLNDPIQCDNPYQTTLPATWINRTADAGSQIENLNNASGAGAPKINPLLSSARAGLGRTPGGPNCLVFRLSSLRGDRPTSPTSIAVVQSLFVP